METVSKKPKRGRPRLIPADAQAALQMVAGEAKSERSRQNCFYALRAIQVLGEDPRFKWLADRARAHENAWRPTILAELGRIWDEETLRDAAAMICAHKPSTRQAAAFIRRVRGVRRQPASGTLLKRLLDTVGRFVDEYPETSWHDVQESIAALEVMIATTVGQRTGPPTPG